jgi:RNA polymerase sigma-70 factor (ECF subfamily)
MYRDLNINPATFPEKASSGATMVRPLPGLARLILWDRAQEAALSSPTDEELLLELRGGQADSLGVLVSRWEAPLFRFVSRMVDRPEDARDVCQETFLRILDKADAFREGARFSTWMYQIALNLCRDQARRKRRWGHLVVATSEPEGMPPHDHAAPTTADTSPVEALEHSERQGAVRKALSRLPHDQREVLLLKEYEGLKFREIAGVLGVPESTVKSRMYAALDTMRSSLAGLGIR